MNTESQQSAAPARELTREELLQRLNTLSKQMSDTIFAHDSCQAIADGMTCDAEHPAVKASPATQAVFQIRLAYDTLLRDQAKTLEAQRVEFNIERRKLMSELEASMNTGNSLATSLNEITEERDRAKRDHERACQTIALMHAAAVGATRGPIRGVVEDVQQVAAERSALRKALARVVGADNAAELRGMKEVIAQSPVPQEDKEATITAIDVLLATIPKPEPKFTDQGESGPGV